MWGSRKGGGGSRKGAGGFTQRRGGFTQRRGKRKGAKHMKSIFNRKERQERK